MPAPDSSTEPDLIERCLSGDDAAWRELIARYQGLIYSVPRRMGMSPEASADVFQCVCVLLYQRLGSIRDPNRLGGWLLTTASREAIRTSRRAKRTVSLDNGRDDAAGSAENDLPDLRPLADEDREAIERAQMLRSALAEMSDRCRTLLEAFLDDEESNYRDVARRLNIPIGSIGPTRARCFSKLKELLAARGLVP
ncbi:MAG: sigma-70 family RNA polymerase sigma factor [Blastocatellia bacterium]|nr:sigma-70 family RNA polymerase sigma factor [Blastocatellia bacterium]MBK6427373.1 sigma-70 family RNA polymerase sigma factor [Blastocatellia bacterium]